MTRRHLTDAQLIEASVGHVASLGHAEQCVEHVEQCAECRGRHESLRALLENTSVAAIADAEAAFSAERLTRQYDRIMERVEQVSRAGRVIRFPAAFGRVTPPSAASGSRWVAAAAAAGLVVGLLGGHLTHDLRVQPGSGIPAAARAARVPGPPPAEDDLHAQVEVAFEGRGPPARRPLVPQNPVARDGRE